MPKERRRSSTREGGGDGRPSFARPPGTSKQVPPSSYPSQQQDSGRRGSNTSNRAREYSDWTSDDDDWSDLERRRRGDPPQTSKRRPDDTRRRSRGHDTSSPATKPRKECRRNVEVEQPVEQRTTDQTTRKSHKRKTSEPPAAYDPKDRQKSRAKYTSGSSADSGTRLLSSQALGKLNNANDLAEFDAKRKARKKREKEYDELRKESKRQAAGHLSKKRNRDVSGAILEEGRSKEKKKSRAHAAGYVSDDGDDYEEKHRTRKSTKRPMSKRKKWLILAAVAIVMLLIIIIAAVIASKNKSKDGGDSKSTSSNTASDSLKNTCDSSKIPANVKGTYLDVSTWLDTSDFNCTYTTETVGGLSVMGLNSEWDDSAQANGNTPALNKQWQYGKMPIRGTNIGGWLNLEPFITPSMFNFAAASNIVDEWTLCQKLGQACSQTLENHYATFINKAEFKAIKDAGLDHVRIPFGYWAVKTYPGDPFVAQISWRYLLRAIEYCRQYGLRVNLDLHGVPGSQNGWAHSGHQGTINWLNGPSGDDNGDKTLDIHNSLSQFFAQDRYKNVVTLYGLVNEPKMINMDDPSKVLAWNKKAIDLVRKNGITQQIVFGDGFLALTEWSDKMKDTGDKKLMLDTHQYQIFNVGQLKLSHTDRVKLACSGWTGIMTAANNPSTGWGPTVNGEWSQADTDCTPNLNNVGAGSRWAGNLNTNSGAGAVAVNTPSCDSPPCSCAPANADPSQYSAQYKQFLQMYAEAQMHSFEQAQGWFYWTWKTESATQWSWKLGLAAGILPQKAYQPKFKCDSDVPNFTSLPG